ncbi:MAG: AraC family transcriptional regulator [Pseudomonadota bacterium]
MALEVLTLSTDDFPDGDRDEVIREHYGKIGQRLEIIPDEDVPFHLDVRATLLPGVMFGGGTASRMEASRSSAMRADGNSDIMLSFQPGGSVVRDGNHDAVIGQGDGVLTALDRPVTLYSVGRTNSFMTVQMSRASLGALAPDLDGLVTRAISIEQPGMRLLKAFANSLRSDALTGPQERELTARHLLEMAALVIGASAEGREQAAMGGLKAARLAAARTMILRQLDSPTLSAATIAGALGVSTRYLHKLFETQPLSFAQFVAERRLARAMRLLSDPAQRHQRVLDIALQAGFGDVTTFNRAFRRRYGKSPSDCRADAPGRPG